MNVPLHVDALGMCCAVGLHTAAATAAMRAGMDHFRKTPFIDHDGIPLRGAMLDDLPENEVQRLAKLALPPVQECAVSCPPECAVVLLLAASSGVSPIQQAEKIQKTDADLEAKRVENQRELYRLCTEDHPFHTASRICDWGKAAIAPALTYATTLLQNHTVRQVLIVGTDSCFTTEKIHAYQAADRLITSQPGNGFLPGEGAGAVLVSLSQPGQSGLHITGAGYAEEPGCWLQEVLPNRATGMTAAIRQAVAHCGHQLIETVFHCGDCSGEEFFFKEITIALGRCLETTLPHYPHLVPAFSLGETGAASGPLVLGYAARLLERKDSFGHKALLHFSSDSGACSALICEWRD